MDFLTGVIGSVLSGGATGLLGIFIQRWFDFKKLQQDIEVIKLNHANALALAQAESERARVRADADMAIADRHAEALEQQAAERSLQASYEHDKATYLPGEALKGKGLSAATARVALAIVDFARGMLRPSLTVYLTVITTLMFHETLRLLEKAGHVWDTSQVVEINKQIVMTILYCFSSVVIWWFGSRPPYSRDAK